MRAPSTSATFPKVHGNLADTYDGLGMTLRPADDSVNPRDQLDLMEGFGQILVRAHSEGADLGIQFRNPREDQHRSVDSAHSQLLEDVETVHVRQVEVETDEIVIIGFAEIEALLAQVGRVDIEPLGTQHQLEGTRDRSVVFDQQNPHAMSYVDSLVKAL